MQLFTDDLFQILPYFISNRICVLTVGLYDYMIWGFKIYDMRGSKYLLFCAHYSYMNINRYCYMNINYDMIHLGHSAAICHYKRSSLLSTSKYLLSWVTVNQVLQYAIRSISFKYETINPIYSAFWFVTWSSFHHISISGFRDYWLRFWFSLIRLASSSALIFWGPDTPAAVRLLCLCWDCSNEWRKWILFRLSCWPFSDSNIYDLGLAAWSTNFPGLHFMVVGSWMFICRILNVLFVVFPWHALDLWPQLIPDHGWMVVVPVYHTPKYLINRYPTSKHIN